MNDDDESCENDENGDDGGDGDRGCGDEKNENVHDARRQAALSLRFRQMRKARSHL